MLYRFMTLRHLIDRCMHSYKHRCIETQIKRRIRMDTCTFIHCAYVTTAYTHSLLQHTCNNRHAFNVTTGYTHSLCGICDKSRHTFIRSWYTLQHSTAAIASGGMRAWPLQHTATNCNTLWGICQQTEDDDGWGRWGSESLIVTPLDAVCNTTVMDSNLHFWRHYVQSVATIWHLKYMGCFSKKRALFWWAFFYTRDV